MEINRKYALRSVEHNYAVKLGETVNLFDLATKIKITTQILKGHKISKRQLDLFAELYPDGIEVTKKDAVAVLKAYDEACADIWRTYIEDDAKVKKAFDEAYALTFATFMNTLAKLAKERRIKMKVLITAGATVVPIDQVRAISNIFKGRTGTNIANYFENEKWDVTIITSNPELINSKNIKVIPYKTFEDLEETMKQTIQNEHFDIIVHSAAVSDYKVYGAFMKSGDDLVEIDKSSKISGSLPELYLKLTPNKKLVDQIRGWGFEGFLVKFKLQVGISDSELIGIANDSLKNSDADMIVANCLETAKTKAWIISKPDYSVKEITRSDIAGSILNNFLKQNSIFE